MKIFLFLFSLITSLKERKKKLLTKPHPSLLSISRSSPQLESLKRQLLLTDQMMAQTARTQFQYETLKAQRERLIIQINAMNRMFEIQNEITIQKSKTASDTYKALNDYIKS